MTSLRPRAVQLARRVGEGRFLSFSAPSPPSIFFIITHPLDKNRACPSAVGPMTVRVRAAFCSGFQLMVRLLAPAGGFEEVLVGPPLFAASPPAALVSVLRGIQQAGRIAGRTSRFHTPAPRPSSSSASSSRLQQPGPTLRSSLRDGGRRGTCVRGAESSGTGPRWLVLCRAYTERLGFSLPHQDECKSRVLLVLPRVRGVAYLWADLPPAAPPGLWASCSPGSAACQVVGRRLVDPPVAEA